MMQGLVHGELAKGDLAASRRLAQARVLPQLEQGCVPLWSLETLAVGTEKSRRLRAENLWRLFGRCRVLLTLRHPVGLVESTYRLILRRENIRCSGGRPWYQSLDEWFDAELNEEVFPHLDYALTYRIYADLFGEESVKVMLFEDLQADPAGFVSEVCRHFRVDHGALGPWPEHRQENRRLSAHQVQLIQRAAKSRLSRTLVWATTPGMRAWLLRPPRSTPGDRGQRLSPENQARIAEITAPGNREIEKLTGLPLGRHGYPMG